jgi:transcriptional regulator with XRE-family HTH domain
LSPHVNGLSTRLVYAMGFAERLRAVMAERCVSGYELARKVPCHRSHISLLAQGKRQPSPRMAQKLDEILDAGGELAALAGKTPASDGIARDDEIAALELVRQATASNVGGPTLDRLEQAIDHLAIAYAGTPPAKLLQRTRAHLSYVTSLMDARKTLTEHRRLLVAGGWLSLLAATSLIDLRQRDASLAHVHTAASLAAETGHRELSAWCLETRAWLMLINGHYRQAVELSRGAQRVAPRGSSAFIQATAQEGRAWARLGSARETYDALARVETLVSPLPEPDHPEHHYRYDPAKSQAYLATTLAWLGDPAAESYARQVLTRLESAADGPPRPRRTASARLDLALALIATERLGEAASTTLDAITSRLLVPSNYWRAEEVISAVAMRSLPESRELQEAYAGICQSAADSDTKALP